MNSSAFLKRFPRPARSSASPFKVLATMRSSSSIELYFVSGLLTVFAIIHDRLIMHTDFMLLKTFASTFTGSPSAQSRSPPPSAHIVRRPGRRSARLWPRSGAAALCAREACRLSGAVYEGLAFFPPGRPRDAINRCSSL